MDILITGANGFIGKNLVQALKNIRDGKDKARAFTSELNLLEFDIDTQPELLDDYCNRADFVFNLAGVNRPIDTSDFMAGNFGFASVLLDTLKMNKNNCPVMLSSSTQSLLDNPYGRSKKAGEELFFAYAKESGAKVLVYRFPNVFGKWCRPNYNSAVATFCHNIAHNLPITINDPSVIMRLVYIDDVVDELLNALSGKENKINEFCEVPTAYTINLQAIVELIYSFKKSREERAIPNMSDEFTKKLYSTYLSYLPQDGFSYDLKMNVDKRGSFSEFIKTPERGQVSVNVIKPGFTKGNHWHHSKNEKFLVVSGRGVIRFRRIDSDEVIEYLVSGEKMEVVDIPTGYTHNISNTGETDMVTVMWANEILDPVRPDTYYEEV